MVQIMKETADVLEYKIGNNAYIANFVCLRKTRMHSLMIVRLSANYKDTASH